MQGRQTPQTKEQMLQQKPQTLHNKPKETMGMMLPMAPNQQSQQANFYKSNVSSKTNANMRSTRIPEF